MFRVRWAWSGTLFRVFRRATRLRQCRRHLAQGSPPLAPPAHMDIGQGWVTTASFSEGLTQLDQRDNAGATSLHEQSYPSPSPSMARS